MRRLIKMMIDPIAICNCSHLLGYDVLRNILNLLFWFVLVIADELIQINEKLGDNNE